MAEREKLEIRKESRKPDARTGPVDMFGWLSHFWDIFLINIYKIQSFNPIL